MNRQVEIKCEQIARMIVKGIPKTRIAREMGMSYAGLTRITACSEYLFIEEQVRNVVVGKMDARLARRAALEDEVDDAVPDAMRVILDSVTKKRDLRAALALLKMDPRQQFATGEATRPTLTQPHNGLGPVGVSSEVLEQAVKDADITHVIIDEAKNTKPAQA